MSQTQDTTTETSNTDTHPTVTRFIENHGADRYEETEAANDVDSVGYIDPSLCVTLFGECIRLHPDIEGSPYGIDVDTLATATDYQTVEIDDETMGYELTHGTESHTVDSEYVEMVADVFDATTETVLENAKVKTKWSDFPVLFEYPGSADVRMMVAPYITD